MQEEKKDSEKQAIKFSYSTNLPAFFQQNKFSLAISTYQAQRVIVAFAHDGKISMRNRVIPRPMGLAADLRRMAVCSKNQIWIFNAQKELRDLKGNKLPFDLIYVPHRSFVTGDVLAHEICWYGEQLIFVNTRFSCLSTLGPNSSFVPLWQPPFISELAPEDRCHLNGIALSQQGPRFASALGETNTAQGWRENKASGGILIDIQTGKILVRGLSMPHSPRIYQNRLFMLESGKGELIACDPTSGQKKTFAKLPGFLRGLAFMGPFAFCGLCKIRESAMFGGLPIEKDHQQLECGIWIVDLRSGESVGFIRFEKGIEELFDISVLPGVSAPEIVGFEEDTLDGIFIIPPAGHSQKQNEPIK